MARGLQEEQEGMVKDRLRSLQDTHTSPEGFVKMQTWLSKSGIEHKILHFCPTPR